MGFSKDHFGWRGREWLSEVGKKRLLQCSRLWRRTPNQDRDQGAGEAGTKSERKGPALDCCESSMGGGRGRRGMIPSFPAQDEVVPFINVEFE